MGGILSSVTGTNNGFVAEGAPITKQDFAPGLEQSAVQFGQTFNNQGALASQLQGIANGTGPNPAQQMLNQATNRNIQQNAGMLASQRGLSPALAQRLIAQNSAQAGQQAAGQGALMGAQQQVGALGQLQGLYGQQQQGALGMNQNLQNAQAQQNNAIAGIQSNLNNTNAATAAGNQQNKAGLVGGLLGGVGAGLGFAHGGSVPQKFAGGGMSGAMSSFGQAMMGGMGGANNPYAGLSALGKGIRGAFTSGSPSDEETQNGYLDVDAMLGTGGLNVAPQFQGMGGINKEVISPDGGIGAIPGVMAADGGKVPGKAQVKGDSYQNDTVDAKLSPGEIVIPRHITMHANAPELAAKFVELELARHQSEKMACGGMAGKYAEGGSIPSALSVNAPEESSLTQMPSKFIPGPERDQEIPEWQRSIDSSASSAFQKAGLPRQQSGEIPQASAEEDQGPAMSPTSGKQKAGGASGGSGGGVDQYLNARQDVAHQATLQDIANNKDTSQKLFNLDVERQNIMNDVKQGHIDPSRLFNNMSTGERIKTTLGLILGGIGSGLTKGPNAALEMLNKHIDNDIKSQEMDMQKNQNLLATNYKATGDVRMAAEMTRIMQRDLINDKLQEVENNAQDPMVRQRAQLMRNQISLQNAQTQGQLQMWSQMQGQQGQGQQDPVAKARAMMAMGVIPHGEADNVFKDLEKSQNADRMKKNMVQAFDQANKENTVVGRASHLGSEPAAVSAMKNLIMPILKDNEGRINEQELQRVDSLVPAPGDTPKKILEKRQAMIQFIDAKSSTPRLEAYGLSGSKRSQGSEQIPVKKGWK